MIFSPKFYPRPVGGMILDGSKTQTRRPVNEGDVFNIEPGRGPVNAVVDTLAERLRWQVGRDYAVQLGRGKPGLWYCPKCKEITGFTPDAKERAEIGEPLFCNKLHESIPLRITITGIRKERLLDILEEDAKKEGFSDRAAFFEAFVKLKNPKAKDMLCPSSFRDYKINPVVEKLVGKFPDKEKYLKVDGKEYNPEVWVLKFEVKP